MPDAVRIPRMVRVEDQLYVSRQLADIPSARLQLSYEVRASIHAAVGGDPHFIVQAARLLLPLGLEGGLEHCMAKTHVAVGPYFLGIRTPKGHKTGHLP